MTCEVCNERPATIVVKKIINGEQTQMRLCESCAREKLAGVKNMFHFSDLFGSFKPLNHHMGSAVNEQESGFDLLTCPECQSTLKTFKDSGKAGCAKCYETFRDYLEPFVKGIHGKIVHTGKIARIKKGEETENAEVAVREISDIRRKLEEAVKEENYELAAEYRDLIHSLTKEETND